MSLDGGGTGGSALRVGRGERRDGLWEPTAEMRGDGARCRREAAAIRGQAGGTSCVEVREDAKVASIQRR